VRFANMGLVPELDDLDMNENGSDDAVRALVIHSPGIACQVVNSCGSASE
jgi:hypothetical protein